MKIMFLSDTHGRHLEISETYGKLPKVDMVIHAGDCTRYGEYDETDDFLKWYNSLNAKHKVLVAGNHDFILQQVDRRNELLLNNYGVTYLEDSFVEIDGIGIYGSPWSPIYGMWAFMKHRNDEMNEVWEKVPKDGSIDIMVTHSPAWGRNDISVRGNLHVGCEMLANHLALINPKVHVCGHIHECGGKIVTESFGTISLNASLLNEYYKLHHPIWIWDSEINEWETIEKNIQP